MLFQVAESLGLKDFKRQFRDVMAACAERNVPVFSLYDKDAVLEGTFQEDTFK